MIAVGVGGADAVDALAGMPWEVKCPKVSNDIIYIYIYVLLYYSYTSFPRSLSESN